MQVARAGVVEGSGKTRIEAQGKRGIEAGGSTTLDLSSGADSQA